MPSSEPNLRGVSKRKGPKSRRWVYKAMYARAQSMMDAARAAGNPQHLYGPALNAYLEAREKWRRIRGWA